MHSYDYDNECILHELGLDSRADSDSGNFYIESNYTYIATFVSAILNQEFIIYIYIGKESIQRCISLSKGTAL